MHKPTIALSLAAGLLGGMLSRYLTPMPVHAQARPPVADYGLPPAGAQPLKLPITLVDPAGNTVGAFMMDPDGLPNIRLYGSSPRTKAGVAEIWAARPGAIFRPATGQ